MEKKDLRIGEWYINDNNAMGVYNGDDPMYGFNWQGKWVENVDIKDWGWKGGDWEKATHKKVEKTLIKEAIERGFVAGATMGKCLDGFDKNRVIMPDTHSYSSKCLWVSCINANGESMVIFKDGKWAEIIKAADTPKENKIVANYEIC
jgi:hypothetical protein